jgi:Trypsin
MYIRSLAWLSSSMTGLWTLWLGACSSSGSARSCPLLAREGSVTQPIVGGSEEQDLVPLSASQRASIALLRPRVMTKESPMCTATYVTPTHALTAAHCLAFDDGVLEGSEARPVVAVHVHPTLDLALLEVDDACSALPPEPLQLADAGMGPLVAESVVIAGFGRTEADAFGALLFAVEPVVAVATDLIRVDGQGRSGACEGDSGGPLLIADGTGRARLAGTLSTGEASCRGIDQYVRLAAALDWPPLRDAVGSR